jgi:selenocysteine insertion sequence-binding protein 2
VGKGRQRPVSKKKKLTALKKQVLLQRFERWNQSQVDKTKLEYQPKSLENEDTLVLQILNYITDYDCIQDEDEYNECVSDLMDLATKIGPVKDSLIPIFNSSEKGVFVLFHHFNDALAARACWNKLVLSGQRLDVSIISKDAMIRKGMEYTQGNSEDQNLDWKQSVLRLDATHLASLRLPIQDLNTSNNSTTGQSIDFTLLLDNILSQEDFDDEECLAESISDIIELVEKYGPVVKERTCVDRSGINQGQVQIVIQGERLLLRSAVEEINGLILGGRKVSARLVDPAVDISSIEKTRPSSVLILSDILGEDEFEDKECLEETRRDIHALVAAYGRVEYMDVKLHGDEAGQVHVSYIEGDGAVQSAVKGLDGTILGGCAIKATCRIMDDDGSRIQPIMSGDKVIPKKYAECKRVPKIPFSDPSDYVVRRNDDSTQILLTEMLGELMRLQISSQDDQRHNRSHDDSPVKIRRRLVMGFREVARGLRAHNVKMVILAYNCDQYDAVDDKVQDILHLAKDQEIPVFFDLSKKKIGKALGKSIKVSVVGINNADGAHAQFKSLKKCANTYPISSDNGVTMDMTPRGR